MEKTKIPTVRLNNGVEMPQIGLGVYQVKDGTEVEQAVTTALEVGYRLIDTAALYGNEEGVGRAIKTSGVPRGEIFVTTKLWNDAHGYDEALKAFDASLKKLDLEYVDLYLIHWPMPGSGKIAETWQAFEKLLADKRVRAIGISNFKPPHMEELLKTAKVMPAVNQIELHPRMQQLETRAFCEAHGIHVEAWSPLMRGGEVLEDPIIQRLTEKYHKTPAQIVLRWHIQSGIIVIPKSVTPERIRSNFDVFDFELSNDDMQDINAMNQDKRIGPDPDNF